eukprot:TRINITY_DN4745_c0_g1_i1.p1 TRINITY_DN4745_c0_g1~~TRINITY_DN4745_c0_g1_i1.p1  ORF type:complete len:431 (+),score=117.90 TRINITY_DN4745_c0_g1_i1:64-1356(+)
MSLAKKVFFTLADLPSDAERPVLACFAQGCPLVDDPSDPLEFELLVKSGANDPTARKLIGESQLMTFSAQQTKKDISSPPPFKYVVGVLNKTTQTVELMEVPHMFMLEQNPKKEVVVKDDTEFRDLSVAEKQSSLVNLFGGRKAQSVVRGRQTNAITNENLVSSSVISGTVKLKAESDPSLIYNVGPVAPPYAPPHDANATEPQDAYKLRDLITPVEVDALDLESWKILTEEDLPALETKYPKYIIEKLRTFILLKFQITDEKLQAFVYLAYLLVFYLCPLRKLVHRDIMEVLEIPPVIFKRFMMDFANQEIGIKGDKKITRSTETELKVLAYIGILSLYVHDFRLPLDELAQTVKLQPAKLSNIFMSLGCRSSKSHKRLKAEEEANVDGAVNEEEEEGSDVKQSGGKTMMVLTTPLRFVAPRRGGMAKR